MRLTIFVFCVVFCCSLASATGKVVRKDGRLAGRVADTIEAAPIPYAYVFVHSGDGKMTVTKVGPDGGFEVRLLPGYYDVFFAAAGFAPACESVEIIAGETVRLAPRMGPSPTSQPATGEKR